MLVEIDKYFYCSAGFKLNDKGCRIFSQFDCDKDHCRHRHHKWPTPEQFKEKYGVEYPDDGAVYFYKGIMNASDGTEPPTATYKWCVMQYDDAAFINNYNPMLSGPIVCACTPWGMPPANWRPS